MRAGKGSAGETSRSLKGSYSSAGERRSEGIDVISLGMDGMGWDEVLSGYERQTIRRRSHRHRTVHHPTHGTGWMGSSGGLVSGLRGLADRQGVPLGAGLARYSCMRFRVHAVPASRCIRPVPRGAWIREVRWRARDWHPPAGSPVGWCWLCCAGLLQNNRGRDQRMESGIGFRRAALHYTLP